MGCTNSTKKEDAVIEGRKINVNGIKSIFHATTEFDLSTSESENEDEMFSIKKLNKNNTKQNLTKNMVGLSSGSTTANINSSTTNSTLLDNRLSQTCL